MTRNQKREIKRLIALGIQRNDAAGYLKACRIIQANGQVPLGYVQPLPIIVHQREIKSFTACHTVGWQVESTLDPAEKEELIKNRLGNALGRGLLDAGLCSFSAYASANGFAPVVTYRATIDVAVPREVQA